MGWERGVESPSADALDECLAQPLPTAGKAPHPEVWRLNRAGVGKNRVSTRYTYCGRSVGERLCIRFCYIQKAQASLAASHASCLDLSEHMSPGRFCAGDGMQFGFPRHTFALRAMRTSISGSSSADGGPARRITTPTPTRTLSGNSLPLPPDDLLAEATVPIPRSVETAVAKCLVAASAGSSLKQLVREDAGRLPNAPEAARETEDGSQVRGGEARTELVRKDEGVAGVLLKIWERSTAAVEKDLYCDAREVTETTADAARRNMWCPVKSETDGQSTHREYSTGSTLAASDQHRCRLCSRVPAGK